MELKFICPECQHTELESIAEDAVVTSPIHYIDDDGGVEYGTPVIEEAEDVSYQCSKCGHSIHARDHVELVEWIQKNCKQEDETKQTNSKYLKIIPN